MAGKNIAAFGIYQNRADAENAVSMLRNNDFRVEDISVLLPENLGSKDLGTEKSTKAPEGVAAGATAGAAIGGTFGLLAGIGALAIPGVGPLIAAGPIMATLAGIGAGGTVGGITGALVGLGIPEYEAKRYEGRVKTGGILLSVHCDNPDWTKKAKDVLAHTGAEDISSTGEASADFAESDRPTPRMAGEVRSSTHDAREGDYEPDYRGHYQTTYGSSGVPYETYSPAYQFGERMASQEQYRGRNFVDVEPNLRREYESSYPGSSWEKMKDAIRYGWDRITGKARGAAR
jgi:hypothetical protein